MQEQIDAQRVQFRQKSYEVLQAATEAVNRPRHNYVELALCGVTTCEPPSGGKSSHPARCDPSPAYECVNSNCVGRNVPSSWRRITAIGARN